MDYQVPQFVDVEDKIFGPLTLKQFIYLAGGAGIIIGLILYLPLFLGIVLSIPIAALSGALAFYKLNGKPFIEILESGLNYYWNKFVGGKDLYTWRKEKHTVEELAAMQAKAAAASVPEEHPTREKLELSGGKLHDLAVSLDIKTGQEDRN